MIAKHYVTMSPSLSCYYGLTVFSTEGLTAACAAAFGLSKLALKTYERHLTLLIRCNKKGQRKEKIPDCLVIPE